jgi:Protein of unknown function (DUF1236)
LAERQIDAWSIHYVGRCINIEPKDILSVHMLSGPMLSGLMRFLRTATFALILLGSGGSIATAGFLNLSGAQEQIIYQSLMNEKGEPLPSGFQPSIGDKLPSSLTLHKLPSRVIDRIPSARRYEYTKLRTDEVLLVDPKDREIVDVISR